MSTPERARETLAKVAAATLPASQLTLTSWENTAITCPHSYGQECARQLVAAGMVTKAIVAIRRSHELVPNEDILAMSDVLIAARAGLLAEAEEQIQWWEMQVEGNEPTTDDVQRAESRVGGRTRSADVRHSCGCMEHIHITDCAELVWRKTLAREAARPCPHHRMDAERAQRTPEQIEREREHTRNVLSDEWEVDYAPRSRREHPA